MVLILLQVLWFNLDGKLQKLSIFGLPTPPFTTTFQMAMASLRAEGWLIGPTEVKALDRGKAVLIRHKDKRTCKILVKTGSNMLDVS